MVLDQKTKFIAAIAIQLIAIFSIILFKLVVLGSGTEVLLHVQPIDPRDYLRGDYVTFQYDISSIEAYRFDYSPVRNGDTVYVPLVKSGQYWIVSYKDQVKKIKPKNAGVYIKGYVISAGNNSWSENDHTVGLEYKIEQYYIPVNTGSGFNFRGHDVSAAVQVGDSGDAVLKKLFVDGKEWPWKSK